VKSTGVAVLVPMYRSLKDDSEVSEVEEDDSGVSGVGEDGSEVSEVGEEGSVEETGGTLSLEIMRIGCSVEGFDRQPQENMRWTIASKIHPAKVELAGTPWKILYISRRCLSSFDRIDSTVCFAIRMDLRSIAHLSKRALASDGRGYTAIPLDENRRSSPGSQRNFGRGLPDRHI
jgi:hypothetical protein